MESNCGCTRNAAKAIELLRLVSEPENGRTVPTSVQAYAYSLLAYIYFERYRGSMAESEAFNHRNAALLGLAKTTLLRAVASADAAVRLGFASNTTVVVARKVDGSAWKDEMFAAYPALSAAYEEYKTFVERKEQPIDLSKWVACSAGCGIEASKASGLSRCSGRCPPTIKPLYCSKECQIIVGRKRAS